MNFHLQWRYLRLLNKKIPKYIIDIESEKRRGVFYLEGIPLPAPEKPVGSAVESKKPDTEPEIDKNALLPIKLRNTSVRIIQKI